MRLNRELTVKQRLLIVGVASLATGLLVAWFNDLPILLGLAGGFGMCLVLVAPMALRACSDKDEGLTRRYFRLDDEPPYIVARSNWRGEFGLSREVIGFYADRLVTTRVKTKSDIPPEIFDPDGGDALAQMPCYGSPRIWWYRDIENVRITETLGTHLRFRVETGFGRFRFMLPEPEAEDLAEALQTLLGDRVCYGESAP